MGIIYVEIHIINLRYVTIVTYPSWEIIESDCPVHQDPAVTPLQAAPEKNNE